MIKTLLTLAIFSVALFTSCSDDEEANSCITCNNIEGSEICDNGDGTADYTITIGGLVLYSDTIEIPEEYSSINDISCEEIELMEIDIELK